MACTADHNCLLKLSSTTVLKKFLHQCVDELAGKEHEKFYNGMDDIEWTAEEHKLATNYIQSIYKKCIFQEDFCPQLNELSSMHISEIKTCFNIRKKDITRAVVKEQLMQSNIPLVENIDWKLKWIIGSSKLSSLSEPLLHVDLNCISNNISSESESKECDKTVSFEMNLSQLDNLIKELEQAKLTF